MHSSHVGVFVLGKKEGNMKNINVLGTSYGIIVDTDLKNSDCDGICYEYDKYIKVRTSDDMLCKDDPAETKKRRYREVLRHEIVHAFFIESGMHRYCEDEDLVDWIAMQFPKMQKAFEDANCL